VNPNRIRNLDSEVGFGSCWGRIGNRGRSRQDLDNRFRPVELAATFTFIACQESYYFDVTWYRTRQASLANKPVKQGSASLSNTTESMGTGSSRQHSGGSLEGAYAPVVVGVTLPAIPGEKKDFKITVPEGKKGGMTMRVEARGKTVDVEIPTWAKPGDSFRYTSPAEIEKVYASTLPYIPGMEVIQSKPIVWGSVSHTFLTSSGEAVKGQQMMGATVAKLMQAAQSAILEQAITSGCNGVLGMNYNVTTDSNQRVKQVIVTCCGTPCLLVASAKETPVVASVIVEPLYSASTAPTATSVYVDY
jgi:uncharacterized protein YbjQ (UPF0145 family)